MKNRMVRLVILILIASACLTGRSISPPPTSAPTAPPLPTRTTAPSQTSIPPTKPIPSPTPTAIPAWEWPRSTPEEQGMSSVVLAEMLRQIQADQRDIHSILVIRNGVLVLEAYAHPFSADVRHNVYSTTKSITSALVGIAAGDGLIDFHTPVVDYFPEVIVDDPRKNEITVENLLAMNSGIEWMEPLHSGLSDLWGILEADDPVQYFFNPALVEVPGAVFNYNSGGSHLGSILVQQTTGERADRFATKRLFGPLGISDIAWQNDFSGHSVGGTGLQLRSADMAKIGQLYLDEGRWQNEQIIPAEWVKESTSVHSHPSDQVGYGYQWWIRPEGDFYSLGWGGQQIRVFREQRMVVVITAGEEGENILHNDLVDGFLIPAVQAQGALPADPQALAGLDAALVEFESPREWPSRPLSPLAAEIDGRQWLVTGMGDWSMFSLHFTDSAQAELELTMDGDPMHLAVGLDGIYRETDTAELGPVALAGYWESDDSFVIVEQILHDADRRITRITFNGEQASLHSEWTVEKYEEDTEAELFGD